MTEARVRQLTVDHLGALADLAGQEQKLQQCSAGYFKLPVVPKALYQGDRGALFYINQKGHRVYLNARQKEAFAAGQLPGVTTPRALVNADPRALFTRVRRRIQASRVV